MTEKHLTAQIKRLLRLPWAPTSPDDAREIAAEFKRHLRLCRSDAELTTVTDRLVDAFQDRGGKQVSCCPSPAEVARAVEQIAEKRRRKAAEHSPERWKHPPKCEVCGDTGWMVVHGKRGDGVARCSNGCPIPAAVAV